MRFVFMGSPQEVIAPLKKLMSYCSENGFPLPLIVSQAARPVGRNLVLTNPPVAVFCKDNNLSILQPDNVNDAAFLDVLRSYKPDIIITAAYGQMLGPEFLKIPQRATINIHPSLLPAYRGATPVPQAILDGLHTTGVTILFTVQAMDAGNVIVQKSFAIGEDETQDCLRDRLFHESGPMLIEAISLLGDKNFSGIPQDPNAVTRCKKIKKEDGRIDWSAPAESLMRQYRAYLPWPGVFTHFDGRRVSIQRLSLSTHEKNGQELTPGAFQHIKGSKEILVGTGTVALKIERLTIAGGKEMDASSFVNGLKDGPIRRFE